MRAVENNRWLLRDTNTGVTAVIDPYGRRVAEAPRWQRTALQGAYDLEQDTTFYTRHGDWFPIVCAIIAVLGLAFAVLPQPLAVADAASPTGFRSYLNMVEELEQEYAALRDKVHDLQEYL